MLDVMPPESSFYTTARGQCFLALVGERLRWFWPDLGQQHAVLGLGHTAAYLEKLENGRATPACLVAANAPLWGATSTPGLSCVVDLHSLPFQPKQFDRVLMVHALDDRQHSVSVLRAAGQVMKPDGRLLLIVPSRFGGRARLRGTPFRHDAAFSRRCLKQTLASAMLKPEQWDEALFLPTGAMRWMRHNGRKMDIAGKMLCPGAGSLILGEAVRDEYSALSLPVKARQRWLARSLLPVRGTAKAIQDRKYVSRISRR